jgi:hypothetical protein
MNPFQGYKVYGPYLHKHIDRRMIFLVSKDHRTSMSYARYLLCIKEGRILGKDEQADHIDNNRLNDDIDNLQILSPKENTLKNRKTAAMVTLVCPRCGDSFTKKRKDTHLVKGGNPSCCSRSCGSKPISSNIK